MKNKAEKKEQKRNLFRLIESFEPANIELAITLMQGDQSLYDTARNRYFPLLRHIDRDLGKGFRGLYDMAERLKSPNSHISFMIECIKHYRALNDMEGLARIAEAVPKEHISKVHKIAYLNQLLQLEGLPNFHIKEVELYMESGELSIPPTTQVFKRLEDLTLSSMQHLEQFLQVFDTMESLNTLSVGGCGLKQVPAEIMRRKTLTYLNLRQNQLGALPDDFMQLRSLKTLYLCKNHFKVLPYLLQRLPNIEHLWCTGADLLELPDWLPKIEKLATLHIESNKMKELSPRVFECPALSGLYAYNNDFSNLMIDAQQHSKSLTWLEIGRNKFSAFPQKIFLLEQLEQLHIDNCQIINLPAAIGSLAKLRWLNVRQNRITELPESIGELQHLEWIEAGNQPLKKIPESIGKLSKLKGLSLRESNLRDVPESIQQLQNLEHLDLRRTPIDENGILALKLKEWLPKCKVLTGYW